MMIQRRDLIKLILLSIITCGIYGIIFWYRYAEDMNVVCQGDGEHTQNYIVVILLSIITCGIYQFIFFYRIGNRLARNAPRYGLAFNEDGMTILLWEILGSFLCGLGMLVSWHIMIKNMNALGEAYNNHNFGTFSAPNPINPPPDSPNRLQ